MSNTFIDQIPTLYFFTNVNSMPILGFSTSYHLVLRVLGMKKTQFKAALRS